MKNLSQKYTSLTFGFLTKYEKYNTKKRRLLIKQTEHFNF